MQYGEHFSQLKTPQGQKIPGSKQVPNSAGGYSFPVDDWVRLERFLVLGSEGGSYYATERKLTVENCQAVLRCIEQDPKRVVDTLVDVSDKGRAPKNDQAIFVLALVSASKSPETRQLAYSALPKVCRIGTHVFQFVSEMERQRGWSRGMRTAVARWYTDRKDDNLGEQLTKYQQRNGWSHKDLLRLCHPTGSALQSRMFQWAVGKMTNGESDYADLPLVIVGFERAMRSKEARPKEAAKIVVDYKLPRECVPTEWLVHPEVWEALLVGMPMTAMVRNLGNMTKCDLVKPLSAAANTVAERLRDPDRLKRARVHPLSILTAMKTYSQGKGMRGSGVWTPVQSVVDAMDDAFYLAFGNVTPTGKRLHIALDVSGSMSMGSVAGSPLTPREAAAALALVAAKTEKEYFVTSFQAVLTPLTVSPKDRLDTVVRRTEALPFGGTDCAVPMLYSLKNKIENDAFVVLTDSETWAGSMHPTQALEQYRRQMGIPAKLAVVGMVSNGFSIADPDDAGMLDCVGFDTATPEVVSSFVRG